MKSTLKNLAISICFVLISLAGSFAGQTVRVSWDRKADFSKFKTYEWMATQQPIPNEANHIRITRAVENGMEQKGFQKAAFEEPDVLILYKAGVTQKVGADSYQTVSTWDPTDVKTMMDFHRQKKGTLTLEMYDGETDALIWRAVGSEVLPKPDKVEKAIDKAVHSLLRHYPPGSTPGTSTK
jgi:hypothetical protein